jgi:hypothetical protein
MRDRDFKSTLEMSDSFNHKLVFSFPLLMDTSRLSSHENLSDV